MKITDVSRCTMEVIEVEEFLRNPPPGFTVEAGYGFVKSDPETAACSSMTSSYPEEEK